ncbi:MAG: hypothetical protein AAF902_20610 [Chloroflexota bacterium]
MSQRAIDLHLLALENGGQYEQSGNRLEYNLRFQDMLYSSTNFQISSVLRFGSNIQKIFLFDFMCQYTKVSHTEKLYFNDRNFLGIVFAINNRSVPTFNIAKEGGYSNSGFAKINRSLYPKWVPESVFISANPHEIPQILQFLSAHDDLAEIVFMENFKAILFRDHAATIYFDDRLRANKTSLDFWLTKAEIILNFANSQSHVHHFTNQPSMITNYQNADQALHIPEVVKAI